MGQDIIPKPKYDKNNPPPFHPDLNYPISYSYFPNNNLDYSKSPVNKSNLNNNEFNNNNLNEINTNIMNKEEKRAIKQNNNLVNENSALDYNKSQNQKKKSKKDDFSIDINIITKDRVEVKIPIEGKKKGIHLSI